MRSVRAVRWFRPLVGAQRWDYVVVWKLGNDPTRFIEWMGCCCSGGCDSEEQKNEKSLCRDVYFKHSARTKACEALAQFPSSMELYSGVHTEVVISRKPRWISDGFGTRAFIPVEGGLIELYSAKNIPKDQQVLEMALSHCKKISLEQETTCNPCLVPSSSQPCTLTAMDGSPSIDSSTSNQSNHRHKSRYEHLKQSSERCSGSKSVGLVAVCESEKSAKRVNRRKEKEDYQSKNLLAERERRKRIRNGLLTLRSLVPKITKMDMASILGDAVDYIRDLQMEEMELRDELNEMGEEEEEEGRNKPKGLDSCSIPTEKTNDSSTFGAKKQQEVKVEVNQIGEREFFIKLFIAHKQGGFVRLLEVMDSLNLQVVSTNSTTFDGRVQNILEIKADKDIEPNELREFFTELTS